MVPPALSLVADIGGTNTRVALADAATVQVDSVRRYRNAEFDGIASVIARYLEDSGQNADGITGVCVAMAGPVHDGVGTLTNLDWRIDKAVLAEALTAEHVAVLNDLQAQGHAIGNIAEADLETILPQPEVPETAAKLVIGLGTGFNACPVFDTKAGRFVPPSEAGHVSLPTSITELHPLLENLTDSQGYPSVEEVLSGRGVSQLHAALHGETVDPADILARIGEGEALATDTGALFVKVLGDVAGNLALSHLPFGGVSLVGGVTRAFAPYLEQFEFAAAFRSKGRFSTFMEQFGVCVVSDDYAALTGCASHLARG
ncbi:ROK family protein [Gymnodinialimonas ceratoperidinii]|uniref:Glucokinase n=1 Tax=Gymnodinialimonas ceratoperidinii TaxID=2856823 RepID=A0A8F6TUZ9_9RHOB|nr:ROK family protein [Gymnodinialimonas ceratoperidinii]QXT38644.1 glucokinase [Gymnodinialimonas ceratoperidinii]